MLKEMFGQYAATGGAYSSKLGKLWTTLLTQLELDAKVCQHEATSQSACGDPDRSMTTVGLDTWLQTMVKKAKKSMDSASALAKAAVC